MLAARGDGANALAPAAAELILAPAVVATATTTASSAAGAAFPVAVAEEQPCSGTDQQYQDQ